MYFLRMSSRNEEGAFQGYKLIDVYMIRSIFDMHALEME